MFLKPSDLQIPPPDDETQFEKLCLDLYRLKFGDQTQRHGRRGQTQDGVDIFFTDKDIGIQCKKKEHGNGKVTEGELKQEVKKAKQFEPALKKYILATTCKRDANIQKVARIISKEHIEKNLFYVQIDSWDDIKELLDKYPKIYEKYYFQAQKKEFKTETLELKSKSRHQELNEIRDLLNNNQPKTALNSLKKFENNKWDQLEDKEKYRVLTNQASALIAMRKEQQASALIIKALQFNKKDEDAYTNCAIAYLFYRNFKKAEQFIKKAKNLNPLNVMAHVVEIKIKDQEGQVLKNIVSFLPNALKGNSQIALILSSIGIKKKEYIEAKQWLDIFYNNREQNTDGGWKNIQDEADYADISLGLILSKTEVSSGRRVTDDLKKKTKEIIKIYKKLVIDDKYSEIREFNPNWYLHYALALELNEELEEAIRALQTGIDKFQNDEHLKIELSRLFEKIKSIDKSIDILEKLLGLEFIDSKNSTKKLLDSDQLEIEGKLFYLILILVDLYFQKNQQGIAWDLLNRIEKSSSVSEDQVLEITRYKVIRLIKFGKIKEAEQKTNSLFEKNKKDIMNLILKSKVEKAKAKACEGKIKDFKLHIKNSTQYLELAYNVFKSKVYKEQDNQQGFERKERLRDMQVLSYELYTSKMYKEAEDLLIEITNNNLNHPEIFKLLHIYFENGKNEQAIKLAKKLFDKFPERIESANTLFLIYENLGDRETAIQYYEKFYEKNPENNFIRIELSLIYIRRGDILKAKNFLKEDFKLDKLSSDQISRLSFAYSKTGHTKKALEILYPYIKNNPRGLEAKKAYFSLITFLDQQNLYNLQNPNQAESQVDYSFLDPKTVDKDCYVKIKDLDNSKKIDLIIEQDADIHTLDHELSKALLGKKKDEIISLGNDRYQILEIKSKYIHKWHKMAEENKIQHPTKSFVKLFSIPKNADKKAILKTLENINPDFLKQQEDIAKLHAFYNQGRATIGSIAKISGKHSIEVIGDLIGFKNKWISAVPQWEKHQNIQELLDTHTNILIDLSSLIAIHWLEIEQSIESSPFKIFICQSTIDSLTEYINKMSLHLKSGHLTGGFDKKGQFKISPTPADTIKTNLNFWMKIKTWAKDYCQIKPLSTKIVLSRKDKQHKENLFGKEFFDSLLAVESNFIF